MKYPDRDRPWSPFNERGKLRIATNRSPWWRRAWARIRREPIWYQMGALKDDPK